MLALYDNVNIPLPVPFDWFELNQLSIWLIVQFALEFKMIAADPDPNPTDKFEGFVDMYDGAPACVTVTVADAPPPLIVRVPVRGLVLVLALAVNPNPPLPVPPPDGYGINQLSQLILQLTLEVIIMLPRSVTLYATGKVWGVTVINGAPSCVIVTIVEVPPPLIVMVPVRKLGLVLALYDNVNNPLPVPLD